jgi:hypothetical protein
MFTNNKKGFAINMNNALPTPNKAALYNIFKKASEELPNFTVEGINKSYKKGPAYDKIPVAKAVSKHGTIEAGIIKRVPRNLVCMGVSKRADVTFEKESSIRLSPLVTLVPIFNVELHFNNIVNAIAAYLLAAYGWKILAEKPKADKKKKKNKKNKKNKNVFRIFGKREESVTTRQVVVHAH